MTTETNIIRTIVNKFEGRCYRCGCTVRRGNGLAEQVVDSRTGGTKWQNRHDDGCCYTKADGMGWLLDNSRWEKKTGVVIPLPEAPKAEVVEAPKAEVVEVDVFSADVLEAVETKPARCQSRKTYGVSHRHACDQDWIDMLNDADPSEAELAAAEAEVEAAETAEAAEIAVAQDISTIKFYRTNLRCITCRMTTRSKNTEIMHYEHCETKEQSAELLAELKARVAKMLANRAATIAAKALVGVDVSGNVAKVEGQTGLYTVRPTSCTCPAHRFGKGKPCKHIERVKHAVVLAARAWPQRYDPIVWQMTA
jgi:hypothetical protein